LGAFSHRVLLAWLAVVVQPSIRGMLVVRITSAPADLPLYEVQAKAKARARERGRGGHQDRGRAAVPPVLHPGGSAVRPPRGALRRRRDQAGPLESV
jgi:hypothetical protein